MNEAHSGESAAEISAAVARQREAADAIVTVYEDGPLILRGQFVITAQDGQPIPAGRRTVALCRCGRSAMKPFCDGSHARTGFRAPGRAQGPRAASGDRAGTAGQPAAE
jgi:CDGSH-type Zn-finger protein